jgi:predicted RNA-binding Zn-ribbon protein involved in translation (DUF1610 family)
MIGRVAMTCPVCGVKLRVLHGRSELIGLLAVVVPFVVMAVSLFVVPVIRRSTDYYLRMGVFAIVMFSAVRLHRRNIPRLLRVRLLQDKETAQFPLVRSPVLEVESSDPVVLEPMQDDRPSWVCPKCGEQSPGNFNECWKCLALRPEADE